LIDISVSEPTGDRYGWHKSSYSNSGGGGCVEVKHGQNATLIRDSKDQRIGQPIIGVTHEGWSSFVTTIANS